MGFRIKNIANSPVIRPLVNTSVYKFVSADIRETMVASGCGKRYVRIHNNGDIFKAAKLSARQLYKRKGFLTVILGTAGLFSPIPAGSAIGATTGSLITRGVKSLFKSNFVKSALKVFKL